MNYLIKIDCNYDDLFLMDIVIFDKNTKFIGDNMYTITNLDLLGVPLSDNSIINSIGIKNIVLTREQMWW